MSDFDPYLKWLGIRNADQQLNHYRLLGLELFENDHDVISGAADRQMVHVRSFQSGPQGALSQRILSELAIARRCLLSGPEKQAYDQSLLARHSGAASQSAIRSAAPVATELLSASVPPPMQTAAQPAISIKTSPVSTVGFAGVAKKAENAPVAIGVGVGANDNLRSRRKRRDSKQMLWSVGAWLSGGLSAVAVAAVIIKSGVLGNDSDVLEEVPGSVDADRSLAYSDSRNISRNRRSSSRPSSRRNSSRPDANGFSSVNPPANVSPLTVPTTPDSKTADRDRPSLFSPAERNPIDPLSEFPASGNLAGESNSRPRINEEENEKSPGTMFPGSEFASAGFGAKPIKPDAAANELVEKFEIPSVDDINLVTGEVVQRYARDYRNARYSSYARGRVENALVGAAEIADTGSVKQYVLFQQLVEFNVFYGDLGAAVKAIDDLDAVFKIDYWEFVDAAIEGAAAKTTRDTVSDFKESLDSVIEKAIRDNEFKEAENLVKLGSNIAKQRDDDESYQRYQKKRKEIRKFKDLAKGNERAMVALQINPDNPAANLTRGIYLFTVEADGGKAMAHFAKSSDAELQAVAHLEADAALDDSTSRNLESLVQRAEAWESIAHSQSGPLETKSLERAIVCYYAARSLGDSLERERIAEKIELLSQKLTD